MAHFLSWTVGNEHREQQQGQPGDLPRQAHHHRQGEQEADDVGDDARQRPGERPLGPDHVVVQPAHQGAGAGPGEEGDRHPLHVGEHGAAQVEDQPFADAGRLPPLGDPHGGVEHGQHGDDQRQAHDRPLAAPVDDGVHDLAGEHGAGHGQDGPHHAEGQEGGQLAPLRAGEGPDAPERRPGQRPARPVGLHGALQGHPVAEPHVHPFVLLALRATDGPAGQVCYFELT
ncbi:MAG TPA: hypothetical protein VM263_06540 [Acidimicrobiales bacterium]|nr:hypothetical protein [Acidimicrobiales bacterium]